MGSDFDEKQWLEEELASFMRARDTSPVVKQLFVPDSSLPKFQDFHLKWDEKAFHRAVSFVANKRGNLDALCRPLQDIIFDRFGGVAALTKQYRKDLEETWYRADEHGQRQARCNKFMGKVLEFHAAAFVERHYGWQTESMEAFQVSVLSPDVLCSTNSNEKIAIACKSLCQSPEVFDLTVQAGSNNGVSVGWLSIYSPIDYLLFRICEGAWSLKQFADGYRIVMVPLLHAANFKLQLDDNWIDFSDLQFLNRDAQMVEFWRTRQAERDRAVETLRTMSGHVDGIVICDIGNDFEFTVCKEHWFREIPRKA